MNPSLVEVDAQVFCSLELILFGLVGAVMGRLMAGKDERPNS